MANFLSFSVIFPLLQDGFGRPLFYWKKYFQKKVRFLLTIPLRYDNM